MDPWTASVVKGLFGLEERRRVMKRLMLVGLLALAGMPVLAQEVPEGQRWIQQLSGGSIVPFSRQASRDFDLGLGGDLGVGYRFTRQFALSLNLGYYDLDQRFYGASSGEWIYVPLSLSARYSWTTERFRPYVSLGVGLAFNNYSFSIGSGGSGPQEHRAGTDLLLSPGLGMLFILGGDLAAFVQGRADFVFTPKAGPGQPPVDTPTIFLPILVGISFFPTK
jgi:opacity protein-like surface antigen